MRMMPFAAIGALGLALAASSSGMGQTSGDAEHKDRTYGYVDLKTGLFHPAVEAEVSPETTTTLKTYTGTFEATITTTIDSTFPSGSTILCDMTVGGSVDGANYSEIASAPATISGTKATCTIKLPYSWTGPAGGSTAAYAYSATYKVTASHVSSSTQPITDFNVLRQSGGNLLTTSTAAIPATGAVTKFTVDPIL
jgi:hypothetical protein